MSEPDDTYDDDDALAAEYVLHLLDAADRRAFEARLAVDGALRARVHGWEARLAPLAEEVDAVAPSGAVRRRLMDTVGPPSAPRGRWSIRGWLTAGVLAAGLLVIAVFGGIFGRAPDLTPAFEAELASEDGSVVIVAGVIPATHEIVIERIAGAPPEGRVHEVWLIAEGANAPVSLGLLERSGTTRIRVPDAIAPGVRTGTLAISEEPPGGSPTGAPTGPVVAAAQFSDI